VRTGILGKPASLSAIQALDTSAFSDGDVIYLRGRTSVGDGGEGHFRWDSSDRSTEVAADEVTASEGNGGIYIAPASDKTGASGAWVRMGTNDQSIYQAAWWGVRGDGQDHGAAMAKAVSSVIAHARDGRGELICPSGVIGYSQKFAEITTPITIKGLGSEVTVFQPTSSYSDYAIRINDCWRNISGALTATSPGGNENLGVRLEGFSIIADRANPARGVWCYKRNDTMLWRDIKIKYLNGNALSIGAGEFFGGPYDDSLGLVRESSFYDVQVWNCGNDTEPAWVISTGSTVGDGTNNLHHYRCTMQHPFGRGLVITHEDPSSSNDTRRIRFYGLLAHGQNESALDAVEGNVVEIIGNVSDMVATATSLNGSTENTTSGNKYDCLSIQADPNDSNSYPTQIYVLVMIAGSKGNGIHIEAGDALTFEGFSGTSGAGNEIEGDELIVDANAIPSGSSRMMQYRIVAAPGLRSVSIDSSIAHKVNWAVVGDNNFPLRITASRAILFNDSQASSPSINFGTDADPNGNVTADNGSLYIRRNNDSRRVWDKIWINSDGTAWKPVKTYISATATQLGDAADAINTGQSVAGVMAWDSTNNRPLWKKGTNDTDSWVDGTGTNQINPS